MALRGTDELLKQAGFGPPELRTGSDALDVRLFGSLQLSHRGAAVTFNAPAKAASLFAYLLLSGERKVSREALAFLLWADDDEYRAGPICGAIFNCCFKLCPKARRRLGC